MENWSGDFDNISDDENSNYYDEDDVSENDLDLDDPIDPMGNINEF